MSLNYYLPRTDREKATWLKNFRIKLGTHRVTLGITDAEIESAKKDEEMFVWLLLCVDLLTSEKEERVKYKNILRDGPIGTPADTLPEMGELPEPPEKVAAGIFPRVQKLVQRIKNHPNYNEAIGKDLGIIGAEQTFDPAGMKPQLKTTKLGNGIEIQWKKGNADALRIEVDRGDNTWQFLTIDTEPHYLDTATTTIATTWKYRAIYLMNDQPAGQWSDVTSISVGS